VKNLLVIGAVVVGGVLLYQRLKTPAAAGQPKTLLGWMTGRDWTAADANDK
jgi:hypothetical protein